MTDACLYEKRSSNLDEMAAGIRMAALISGGRARHEITMANDQALELARIIEHRIPVTRQTVLTHAEVQPTLGIRQRGKWDIRCLPGDRAIRDAVVVGDELRAQIKRMAA